MWITLPECPPPQTDVADIDGSAVLRAIAAQHGIFVERARGVYSFAHLTFQEYFAARYIYENEAKGTLKALIKMHVLEDSWREVFLLKASLLDDADEFFDVLISHASSLLPHKPNVNEMMHLSVDLEDKNESTPAHRLSMRSMVIYFSRDLALALDRARALDLDLAEEGMQTITELQDYLRATGLLVRCLEVAYVSDRGALEDQLLVPNQDFSETE